jgi:prepilin-type processing-associated H-X9-DG protein
LGRGHDPKSYNGAEWLASLYWTGYVPDPGVFICPSSGDTNHNGVDLGATRTTATFGSQTVSYAAMHWRTITACGSAIRDDFPPNETMASDDTQGTINHGSRTYGGMSVLFFDAHVEFKTNEEIDLEHGVGQKGGVLEKLRN